MSQVKNLSAEGGGGGAAARGPNTEDRKSFAKAKADGVDKVCLWHILLMNINISFSWCAGSSDFWAQRHCLQ